MARYVTTRVGHAVFVLLGVTVITFLLLYLLPADPARMIAGRSATVETVSRIRHELGLDQPLPVQYGRYLWGTLHGDMGRSYVQKIEVSQMILARLPATAQLALAGIAAELLIGLPVGVGAAVRRGKGADQLSMILAFLGVSAPQFAVGLLLIYALAYRFPLLPLGGYGSPAHLVLPALTLGLAGGGWYARMVRSNMVDVLGQQYVRTATAKGLSRRTVVLKHAFRNALLPIVSMVGLDIGIFMSGVVVVETAFGWPGIGQLLWQAIQLVDIPVIMGVVTVAAVTIVLGNLLADLAYPLLDPRIEYR
ncbi:ABC transporter permease [Limnochorda pilosa]|uniref:Glutathione ABC transporter permease n=1 Tax=Limnochorda pilosa TaxID=1555112 RepID=A0A0K2SGZ5_LIMPI|nr:ABC transporter permease [Limnochorda pilosa]BAS26383.1 glutathione ABC transporter permease [Limnochorda pilosa]